MFVAAGEQLLPLPLDRRTQDGGLNRASQGTPCGSASVYCPEASTVPLPVPKGRYSAPLAVAYIIPSSTLPCEPGQPELRHSSITTQWLAGESDPMHGT